MTASARRLLIADGHRPFRRGLRSLLSAVDGIEAVTRSNRGAHDAPRDRGRPSGRRRSLRLRLRLTAGRTDGPTVDIDVVSGDDEFIIA
jgi:hypothetical protein